MCDFILHTFRHLHDSSAAFPQNYWLKDVVVYPPVVDLYRKTCQPCGFFSVLARFQSGGLKCFPNPDVH